MNIIYKHTNRHNNKSYIGKTSKTIDNRLHTHIMSAMSGSTSVFHKAIRKYGIDSFDSFVLEYDIPDDIINIREKYWISFYNTNISGYNMTIGGDILTFHPNRSYILSNMRLRVGPKNPFYGKKHTSLTKKILSDHRLGKKTRPHTTQTKQKIRDKAVGRLHTDSTKKLLSDQRLGNTVHTDNSKKKISDASKNHWKNEEYRNKCSLNLLKNNPNKLSHDVYSNIESLLIKGTKVSDIANICDCSVTPIYRIKNKLSIN